MDLELNKMLKETLLIYFRGVLFCVLKWKNKYVVSYMRF